METRDYTVGCSNGLEAYTRRMAETLTFGAPNIHGFLSSPGPRDEYMDGYLRGLALGATLRARRMQETIGLRP